MMYAHHVHQNRRAEDVSIVDLSDVMIRDTMISRSSLTSPLSRSSQSVVRPRSRVRFLDTVTMHEVPSRDTFSVEIKRRIWWTKAEEAMIEREVHDIANMMDLNRLPDRICSYGHVRGPVAFTNKATLNRVLQRGRQYRGVFALQGMHRKENSGAYVNRTAEQSLKRTLIAKLCANISQSCTQQALEVARLDAEQAELVYQEVIGDMEVAFFEGLTCGTEPEDKCEFKTSTFNAILSFEENY
jgi:hypothetical protein